MEPLSAEYRETGYRWVILTMFVLVAFMGGIANTTCSAITKQVTKIYDVSILAVQMNSMIYEFAFISLVLPCNYIADKFELRISVRTTQMNIAAGLTLGGAVLRCAGVWAFWPVLLGNAFIAAAVVIGSVCTAKVSAFWFRPQWVRRT